MSSIKDREGLREGTGLNNSWVASSEPGPQPYWESVGTAQEKGVDTALQQQCCPVFVTSN